MLRLARLVEARGGDPFYAAHLLDSAYYDEMGRRLVEGSFSGPYLMAPLYGYFLAFVYTVEGWFGAAASPTPVYLLQVIMGALTAGLAALLAARLGERFSRAGAAAWVGGLAVAVYPIDILYDARLLSVALATFLATLGAWLLQRVWDQPAGRGRDALLAGLVLGLATTARGNLIFALPLLVLALAWTRRWRPMFLLAAGIAAPLSFCAIHNHNAGAGFAPVSVNGGVNLYRGNNPYVVDEAVQPFRLPAENDALARKSKLVASIDSGRWLSESETDRYWINRTLVHWRQDPLHYVALTLRKAGQVLSAKEVSDNVDTAGMRRGSTVLRWLPPLYGPLVGLALVGMVVAGRRRADLPLFIQIVVGVGSVALFFVVDRYRLPLVPLWACYAGGAVAWGLAEKAAGRTGRLAAGLAGVVACWGLFSLPPTDPLLPYNALIAPPPTDKPCAVDSFVRRDPALETRFRTGVIALIAGDTTTAEQVFREVIKTDPQHTAAAVDLSGLLVERGGPALPEAASVAAAAIKVDPCDDKAYANLGLALYGMGQLQPAVGALSKAAEIDPYEPAWRAAMGQGWLAANRPKEAREALEFAVKWDPAGWKAQTLLARLDLKERRIDEALALLAQATERAPDRPDVWALYGLAWLGKGELDKGEVALKRGEAIVAQTGRPDPLIEALRRAYDQESPWTAPAVEPSKPAASGQP